MRWKWSRTTWPPSGARRSDQTWDRSKPRKTAIRDGCLQQPWPAAFEMAARIGFDGLDLDLGADYEQTLPWSAAGRRKLHDIIGASGLELASFGTGVRWTISPASDDPAIRRRLRDMLGEACTHAAA